MKLFFYLWRMFNGTILVEECKKEENYGKY